MSIIEKAVDRLDHPAQGHQRFADRPAEVTRAAPRADAAPAHLVPESFAPAPPPTGGVAERVAGALLEGLQDQPVRDPGSGYTVGRRSREVKVDLEGLKAAGVLTPGDTESQTAEECRLIKRPLLHAAFGAETTLGERRNLVMMTSSVPGEGKTFLSVSLAMSMAMELDRTVLLVDGDVFRNGVSQRLGIEAAEGLTDVLAGRVAELADVMLRTDVPKLTVLPAGQAYPNATELLASDAMRAVADELSRRYADRIVLFDSPPLLAASGASVLARLMGQVVLVVEAERTPRSAVKEALRLIHGCHVAGLILNKSRQRLIGSYDYRYGYGYGYKSYGYGRQASGA